MTFEFLLGFIVIHSKNEDPRVSNNEYQKEGNILRMRIKFRYIKKK